VVAVEPRRNLLPRPAVANVNRVMVVAPLVEPTLDPLQLTRFLVAAEATGAAVELVLTKADLVDAAALTASCQELESWGYPLWSLSTRTGLGLEPLRRRLAALQGITVLCGPSGAGKSSLLNALAPGLDLRVAEVSGRLRRGRHTTRHVELFPLAELGQGGGGAALLADTPGFNRPELPADSASLAAAFPELRHRLAEAGCRFRNCRHLDDPGCAMGTAWVRYPLYRQCLAEVEERVREQRGGRPRTGAGED
jgi:ribosome biogenesis GTPase